MTRSMHILVVAFLGFATFTLGGNNARAGRIGGPLWNVATVPAYQIIYWDVPFAEGDTAVVSIGGNGRTELDLLIFDGDGNVSMATGFGDQKRATMYVYRAGLFRIEIRNRGAFANMFLISTN